MPPFPITQNVTFLYCHDLKATLPFYRDVLGLEQVVDQGACVIFRASPTGYVGICSRANRAVEPKGVVYTFVTPDVDGWYAYLHQKGVKTDGAPGYSDEFRVYAFFAFDPSGYRLEFQEFRDSQWQPGCSDC